MSVGTRSILGGGHCCVCSGVCHHVGGPSLCEQHKGVFRQPGRVVPLPDIPITWVPPEPDASGRVGVGGKPCSARVEAVLGFVEPTWIPCGLADGHSGQHRFEIEWSDS